MPTISPSAKLATGLTVDNEWTTVSNNKKKKSKSKQKPEESDEKLINRDLTPALKSLSVENRVKNSLINANNKTKKVSNNSNVDNNKSEIVRNQFGQPLATEPTKRLRNLKKKLKEIEGLKAKDKKLLEKEQLEKISREEEILEQINELQRFIDNN